MFRVCRKILGMNRKSLKRNSSRKRLKFTRTKPCFKNKRTKSSKISNKKKKNSNCTNRTKRLWSRSSRKCKKRCFMEMSRNRQPFKKLTSWSANFNNCKRREKIKEKLKKTWRRKRTLWTMLTRCTSRFRSKTKTSLFKSSRNWEDSKT